MKLNKKMISVSASIRKKLLGTVLLISFLSSSCGTGEEQAGGPKAIPVKLATLESAILINSTGYVGTLEAVQRVELAPKIDGRILQILVEEGDIVQQGDKIAVLEPTQQKEQVFAASATIQARIAEFNTAEAELRQREAERDSAQAEVARLKADLTGSEAALKSAEADLQRAKAELELAQINYRRSVFLVDTGVQPQQDLDDRTRDLETSKASVESQQKSRDAFAADVQVSKEALNAAIKNLAAAEERVKAERANVDRAKASIDEAKGQKGSIEQDLIFNTMYAPIAGSVGDFNTKKIGDYLNIGETFTTITNNEVFHLNVNVPTEFLNRLRKGLPVEIVKPDGSPGVRGEVTYISPLVAQSSQSVLTKFTFRNDGSLRDEQYVTVRVIWDKKPGLLIPTSAVTSLGGQKFVFVAKPGESEAGKTSLVAKQKPIEVGTIQGQSYQVISGVQAGDRIAVSHILDLKDNTPIVEESVQSQQPITE
jgi:RND family efflux transporter MFP subunit